MLITRRGALALATAGLAGACASKPQSEAPPQTEADIERLLANRIDAQRQSMGIVVGVVDQSGPRVYAHGRRGGHEGAIAPDSVFEIASVSKAVTSLVLADAVQRKELGLDDALTTHVPIKFKDARANSITLRDLATHTAGLPNEAPAAASWEELLAAAADITLDRAPGSAWSYSNLGYQLLGEALERRLGSAFSSLAQTRVLSPLGMNDTVFHLREDMVGRLAIGHSAQLERLSQAPVPEIRAAAAGLYSTAPDVLQLTAAMAGLKQTPLQGAIETMHAQSRPASALRGRQGLGVWVENPGPRSLAGIDGAHPGYSASAAWLRNRRGVAVLSNSGVAVGDMSRNLLDPSRPLATPLVAFAMDPAKLDNYVGRYAAGLLSISITRNRDRLWVESIMGSPRAALTPQSEELFVIPQASARVTFSEFSDGRPARIEVQFGGLKLSGARKLP